MAGQSDRAKPISLFYSYSHKDEDLRLKLETHLSALRRGGLIAEWHDRKLEPGDAWRDEIDRHLASADIVLLLVSSDFIASDYCWGEEMTKALARHARDEARIIPVILRHCRWRNTPLGSLQAVPKDARPIKAWPDEDAAFDDVAAAIERSLQQIRERAEQEARQRTEEEARQRTEEEARQRTEEEARQRTEEEARQRAEEEARQQAEEEAGRRAEKEARQRVEEEAGRRAEEEAGRRAEEEAGRRAEEEARHRAEHEASQRADHQARRREARQRAKEKARQCAEEEARQRAEKWARQRAERRQGSVPRRRHGGGPRRRQDSDHVNGSAWQQSRSAIGTFSSCATNSPGCFGHRGAPSCPRQILMMKMKYTGTRVNGFQVVTDTRKFAVGIVPTGTGTVATTSCISTNSRNVPASRFSSIRIGTSSWRASPSRSRRLRRPRQVTTAIGASS